jgi:transcription factor C subunit 6
VNTVTYSPYAGGPISIDQGSVKVVSLSPAMLNKGHTVTEPDGPVWVRTTFAQFMQHEIADNAS